MAVRPAGHPVTGEKLYNELAEYYDLVEGKSEEEVRRDAREVTRLVGEYGGSDPEGAHLLDVGCGTGRHLRYLENVFDALGVDANEGVLDVARENTAATGFAVADMTALDLADRFDAVTCLFSTIAYAGTEAGVRRTVENFYDHLREGGVAVVEPYNAPAEYKLGEGTPTMLTHDGEDVKVARQQIIRTEGRTSVMEIHYLIAERDAEGVRHVTDTHELWLFDPSELVATMEDVGFDRVEFHEDALSDGAVVGVR